jgi:hypothetical protein
VVDKASGEDPKTSEDERDQLERNNRNDLRPIFYQDLLNTFGERKESDSSETIHRQSIQLNWLTLFTFNWNGKNDRSTWQRESDIAVDRPSFSNKSLSLNYFNLTSFFHKS